MQAKLSKGGEGRQLPWPQAEPMEATWISPREALQLKGVPDSVELAGNT